MLALVKNTKVCSKCEAEKPATKEFFHPNKDGKLGLHSVCRVCRDQRVNAKRAEERLVNPAHKRVDHREERLAAKTKTCSKCGDEKLKKAFAKTGANTIDGLSSWCKLCNNGACSVSRDKTHWTTRLVSSAKERHLKMGFSLERFDLTREFVQELFASQDGLCFWFRIPMTVERKSGPTQASLDRIDPAQGYTRSNVRLTSKSANLARNDTSVEAFTKFVNGLLVGLEKRRSDHGNS